MLEQKGKNVKNLPAQGSGHGYAAPGLIPFRCTITPGKIDITGAIPREWVGVSLACVGGALVLRRLLARPSPQPSHPRQLGGLDLLGAIDLAR